MRSLTVASFANGVGRMSCGTERTYTMNVARARTVLAGITLLTAALAASAKDLYVAPNGNDSNPGTSSAPLATIAAASNKVHPGETVYLMPGKYSEAIIPICREQ